MPKKAAKSKPAKKDKAAAAEEDDEAEEKEDAGKVVVATVKGAKASGEPAAAAKAVKLALEKKVSMGVPRGATPRAAVAAGALTIISWNVNGLRSVIKAAKHALGALVKKYSPDVLVLQETKLQDGQGPELGDLLPGYSAHWTYSIKQKGYSGSVAFVRDTLKACPVTFGIGAKHDGEGRAITVEHPSFFLVSLYVPNSGMKLERLGYRTTEWDPDLLAYLKGLEKKKPVIFTGDLNVAHLDADIYNYSAKHIPKVPGCTPVERQSFTRILEAGFVDTFRKLHPDVKGVYSYWSARTRGRVDNKGLRLDYFVASQSMYDPSAKCRVVDSVVLDDEGRDGDVELSDHCPIMLHVALGP